MIVKWSTIEKMQKYGDSFVRTLAELYMISDYTNKKKLEECFKEYFKYYEGFDEKVIENER